MENIYKDFTTQLLPKIQEGLMITKEYFSDLFGRYVKYLFVMDLFWTIMTLILMIVVLICWIKYTKKAIEANDDFEMWGTIFFIFQGILSIFLPVAFSINLSNVIKDKYVPEIRVIEEIQSYKGS